MAKRSLQASQTGAKLARNAFDRKGWTQENLAAELELKTRQPIWRFFTCRPIERHIFIELCHILDLNWWEIAEHPPEFLLEMVRDPLEAAALPAEPVAESGVEALVKQIRTACQGWIENQCGVLRVLDTSSPTSFDKLYVPVDVMQPRGAGSSDRNARTPALQTVQAWSKLRVMGKPGSGKTSLLKYIALQCMRGSLWTDKVPVVIHLDSFAAYAQEGGKWSLLDFISYEFAGHGIGDSQTVAALLTEGRLLLLLDALDEVSEPASYSVYKEINRFAERYYKNRFVITARLASDRFEFSQFTDVEIADCTDEQVAALAVQWFKVFSTAKEVSRSAEFIGQLQRSENASIAALARLPLLFNAIARLFQTRNELAAYRLEIYESCLNILLERWDRARGMNRAAAQSNIIHAVEQAVLMQLAADGLQQHRSEFERQEIAHWIEAYLHRLDPEADNPVVLQNLSKTVFTALENDHGLLVEQTQGTFTFAFSSFQSYFAALWIVRGIAAGKDADSSVAVLSHHAADPRWREAILLTCALFATDESVIAAVSQTIDRLTAAHPDMVSFVDWTQQILLKSSMYQQLYAGFVLWRRLVRTPVLLAGAAKTLLVLQALIEQLLLEVLLDRLLKHVLLLNLEDTTRLETVATLLERAVELSQRAGYEVEFRTLQSLRQMLLDPNQPATRLHCWWQTNCADWSQQLRQTVADWYADDQYRHLTLEQEQVLGRYAYLNRLLADCLNLRSRQRTSANTNPSKVVSFCPSCLKKTLISPKKTPRIFTRVQAGRIEEIGIS